jgi:SulP family sulfate permease
VEAIRSGQAKRTFASDLIAGVTVGLVALPLAMAFGISSGVTPQAGIYTAIIAGFLISALGGSRVQIGGPTGAFVVIVAGIIAKFGLSGLLMATLMAGAMLVVMGATGLGKAIRFIPRPVTIGFTNGIATLIASTQIKDFLGLNSLSVGPSAASDASSGPDAHRAAPAIGDHHRAACGDREPALGGCRRQYDRRPA